MKIRYYKDEDKLVVDRIYSEFFSNNEYPEFDKFQCAFVVTDNDQIVLAGGVKVIAEAVVVTDQNMPVKVRQEALLQALGSSIHITKELRFKQIHAFVNGDEEYVKHLQKYGFEVLDAKLLILDIGEEHG
jgi:hypothetical protein